MHKVNIMINCQRGPTFEFYQQALFYLFSYLIDAYVLYDITILAIMPRFDSTVINSYGFAGLLTGVVFNAEDNIEYDTPSLHQISKPLDRGDKSLDRLNTLSSKLLGAVLTNREDCKVCGQSAMDCPGHDGIIKNLSLMAVPGRDDAILEMIKHICIICFSISRFTIGAS